MIARLRVACFFLLLSSVRLMADVTGRWTAGGTEYSSCANLATP